MEIPSNQIANPRRFAVVVLSLLVVGAIVQLVFLWAARGSWSTLDNLFRWAFVAGVALALISAPTWLPAPRTAPDLASQFAQSTESRKRWLQLVALGFGITLFHGAPLASRATAWFPQSKVESCLISTTPRSGPRLTLFLSDGDTLVVGEGSLPSQAIRYEDQGAVARCLENGTRVEKRKWELGYRFNGVLVTNPGANVAYEISTAIGILLVCAGFMIHQREIRATSP
jgi:hypothetical protein